MNPWLVVSVHDVAPATFGPSCGWVDELDRLGIRSTLLVIPGPWKGDTLKPGTAFTAWLRRSAQNGHEIAQHGWSHESVAGGGAGRRLTGHLLGRGCEEFWSLDEAQAAARLVRGRVALDVAGLPAPGFTPPGWLASPAATAAVRTVGFRYTTNHRAVLDLAAGHRHPAAVFCHRPASPWEATGAALMKAAAARQPRRGRNLRIALHPDDYLRPHLRRASIDAIRAALAGGARPLTYLDVVSGAVAGRARAA